MALRVRFQEVEDAGDRPVLYVSDSGEHRLQPRFSGQGPPFQGFAEVNPRLLAGLRR